MLSLKANCAVKCALYPTKEQEALLRHAFIERNRWYNIHCAWFRDAWRKPAEELRAWCEAHPGSDTDKALAAQRKAFSSTLKWPSQTKMGWPKSVVHPNEKYLERFGQPVAIFWNAMNEAAEDDLGRAIKTTKAKGRVAFAKRHIKSHPHAQGGHPVERIRHATPRSPTHTRREVTNLARLDAMACAMVPPTRAGRSPFYGT